MSVSASRNVGWYFAVSGWHQPVLWLGASEGFAIPYLAQDGSLKNALEYVGPDDRANLRPYWVQPGDTFRRNSVEYKVRAIVATDRVGVLRLLADSNFGEYNLTLDRDELFAIIQPNGDTYRRLLLQAG